MKAKAYVYEPWHLKLLDMREHEKGVVDKDDLDEAARCGVVVSVFIKNKIVCLLGYYERWDGVLDVFVVPSIYIQRYAKTFVKYVRQYIRSLEESLRPHRIQTASLADEATDRWMRHMGFTCEGTLVKYSKDQRDYRIWARFPAHAS